MSPTNRPLRLLQLLVVFLAVAAPLCGDPGGTGSGGTAGAGSGTAPGSCSRPSAVGGYVPELVEIKSAADVASLTGCTKVAGLWVTNTTDIHDLDGLESLTAVVLDPGVIVSGSLQITSNTGLVSIAGLRNLTRVDQEVYLWGNPVLTQVSLPALATVGDPMDTSGRDVSIFADPAATVVDLSALTSITGTLGVTGMAKLEELRVPSLHSVGTIKGDLTIADNALLAAAALPSLTDLGGSLTVSKSPKLATLTLGSLKSVSGIVAVAADDVLTSLDLPLLTSPIVALDVEQNALLRGVDLSGLPRILKPATRLTNSSDGDLVIDKNASLSSIAFGSLVRVDGTLEIGDDPLLPTSQANALRDKVKAADGIGGTDRIYGDGPG